MPKKQVPFGNFLGCLSCAVHRHNFGKRPFKSDAVKHFIQVFISAVMTYNNTPLFTDQVS